MIPIEVSETKGSDVVEAFCERARADAGVDEQHAAGCTHDGCVSGRPAGKNAKFQSHHPLETRESGGAFFEDATRSRQARATQHLQRLGRLRSRVLLSISKANRTSRAKWVGALRRQRRMAAISAARSPAADTMLQMLRTVLGQKRWCPTRSAHASCSPSSGHNQDSPVGG